MDVQRIEEPNPSERPLKRYSTIAHQTVGFAGGRRGGAHSNTFTPFAASHQFDPPAHHVRSLYIPANEGNIKHDLREKRKVQEPLSETEGKKRLVKPSSGHLLIDTDQASS